MLRYGLPLRQARRVLQVVLRARWIGAFALGAAVVAAGAIPARSENPKLTLKLTGVTAEQAAKELAKASGVPVELYAAGNPAAAANAEKVDFDWNGVSFARALRQLCQKFMLTPGRRPSGYILYNAPGAPPVAAKHVGEVVKNGVKVYARGVSVNEWRRTDFTGQNGGSGYSNLSVEIGCELGDGDADAIAGIENLTAKDDLGNVIQQDQQRNFYGGYGQGTFPDEWYGSVTIPLSSMKAKKLAYVEGDLMVYRKIKRTSVEISLPLADKKVRKQIGDVTIVLSRYRDKDQEPDDDGPDLPRPFQGQTGGPSVQMRIYTPNGSKIAGRAGMGAWGFQPYLVGSTGKTYSPSQASSRGWGDGQMSVNESTLNFPNLTDTPVKLVWEATEREEPVKLLTFRMTELPLPDPTLVLPHKNRAPGVAAPAPESDHPFYEKGGGSLSSRVEISGKPAGDGTLQVGLAPKSGPGWGAIRWMDADVGMDGTARIDDLKPGVYRVVRSYKPKMGAAPLAARWHNAQVEVTIERGKEASPLPLRWSIAVEKGARPAPVTPQGVRSPLKKASAQ